MGFKQILQKIHHRLDRNKFHFVIKPVSCCRLKLALSAVFCVACIESSGASRIFRHILSAECAVSLFHGISTAYLLDRLYLQFLFVVFLISLGNTKQKRPPHCLKRFNLKKKKKTLDKQSKPKTNCTYCKKKTNSLRMLKEYKKDH